MMTYSIVYSGQALKDAKKLKQVDLKEKTERLLKILESNLFQNPPLYEKLIGDFLGVYSRRITIKHRLVYQVDKLRKEVRVLRMWTHYE